MVVKYQNNRVNNDSYMSMSFLLYCALTEPAAVALHGTVKLDITPGSIGAVYGGGLLII